MLLNARCLTSPGDGRMKTESSAGVVASPPLSQSNVARFVGHAISSSAETFCVPLTIFLRRRKIGRSRAHDGLLRLSAKLRPTSSERDVRVPEKSRRELRATQSSVLGFRREFVRAWRSLENACTPTNVREQTAH